MDIKEFNTEVGICWNSCPINTTPDERLDDLSKRELAELAFRLGAGIALVVLKAHGTDEISHGEIAKFPSISPEITALLNKASGF